MMVPLYFFDVDEGEKQFRDEFGIDLTGIDRVPIEVFNLLRDIVHDRMPEGRRLMTVRVRDAGGAPVYFGELTINGKRFLPTTPAGK